MSAKVELRLILPPDAVPALRRHPVFSEASVPVTDDDAEETYYDTPDFLLNARRLSACLRRHGVICEQVISPRMQPVVGLSVAPVWVQPFDGVFDCAHIDDTRLARRLQKHRASLVPVFCARLRRTSSRRESRDGATILMTIEEGMMEAARHSAPIGELVLSLEAGHQLDLYCLAVELARDLPLMPCDLSIADRGYRLLLEESVLPLRSQGSGIGADQTVVDAFVTLAQACVRQWQTNTIGASEVSRDQRPEFIHQLRVGLRRLRSLLKLFRPALPVEFVAEWRARLRDNAIRFGAARDLDVFHDELLDPVSFERLMGTEVIMRLRDRADGARRAAFEETERSLDQGEQGRLILAFTTALLHLPDVSVDIAADLRRFAARRLGRLLKSGRRRYEQATELLPEQLHQLRIATKELRYAMEFFAPLFPRKSVGRYLRHLTRAQTTLGFLQDMEVARVRCENWVQGDPALGMAAGFVLGWHAQRDAETHQKVLKICRPVLWGAVPWKAG